MGKQGQTKKKWENKAKIGIIRKAGPNRKMIGKIWQKTYFF